MLLADSHITMVAQLTINEKIDELNIKRSSTDFLN